MTQAKHEEWEDIDSVDTFSEPPIDREQPSEPVTPPKRAIHRVASPSPFSRPTRELKPSSRSRKHTRMPSKSPVRWGDAVFFTIVFAVTYVFEVFRVALCLLRKPLSLILVGYLLAMLVPHFQYTFGTTLRSILTPICLLPGVSRTTLCQSLHPGDLSLVGPRYSAKQADYPKLFDIQSATFEKLLDDSVGGAGLALEIKKAEMATSDLTTLVRMSGLTSKEKMAETLDTFVEDARRTARGLQRFSAKVGGAVDGIIAVNDFALKRIEMAASGDSSPSLWSSILVPFSKHTISLAILTTSFTQSMAVLEMELHMLIMAAEASLHDLDTLEEQLRLLHAIVLREDDSLSTSKQELLSSLWTIVGGNRAELRRYDSHLKLLGGLAEYRQRALAHVVGALQTLQTMSAELEDLRGRVSRPVLLSDTLPLEVHVRSIRGGLERLTDGRLKSKRLGDAQYGKLAPLEK